jgi:hypothetical protein
VRENCEARLRVCFAELATKLVDVSLSAESNLGQASDCGRQKGQCVYSSLP